MYTDRGKSNPVMMAPSLSQFFEMYIGFGLDSEVAQVGKLLAVDLSPFLEFSPPDSKEITWHELKALQQLVQEFITKIRATPDLYKRIQYSAMPQSHLQEKLLRLTLEGDKPGIAKFVKEWQHIPDSKFPPEIGYVRKGFLLEDLIAFEKTLLELMGDGVKKVQLQYY
jgi:hypothetical protein